MKCLSVIVLIIFATCIISVYGQNSKWELGIEGGPNLAYLSGNAISNHQSNYSFATGTSIHYHLNNVFSLHSKLYYERKGSRFEFNVTDNNAAAIGVTEANLNMDYLGLSVLAQRVIGESFFVNFGPYIGYLTKAEIISKPLENSFGYYPGNIFPVTNDFKNWDVGVSAGTGFVKTVSRTLNVKVEVRYQYGLLNINEYFIRNPYQNSTVKTRSLSLLAGIVVHFPQKED